MSAKIAIVGAGPAGLCSLRHFRKYPEKFTVQAFEQNSQAGGMWVYTEKTGTDERTGLPVHSSVYSGLR